MKYKLYYSWETIEAIDSIPKVVTSLGTQPSFHNDDIKDQGTLRGLYTLIDEEMATIIKLKFPHMKYKLAWINTSFIQDLFLKESLNVDYPLTAPLTQQSIILDEEQAMIMKLKFPTVLFTEVADE